MTKHSLVLSHSEVSDVMSEGLELVGGLDNAVRMVLGLFPGSGAARPFVDEALKLYKRRERLKISIEAGDAFSGRTFELVIAPDGSNEHVEAQRAQRVRTVEKPAAPVDALADGIGALVAGIVAKPYTKPHGKPKKRAQKKRGGKR